MKQRVICWFSRGVASAVAAKLSIEKYAVIQYKFGYKVDGIGGGLPLQDEPELLLETEVVQTTEEQLFVAQVRYVVNDVESEASELTEVTIPAIPTPETPDAPDVEITLS